jgi:hydrogenase maturation factor HypF (carbamoyltransferase family)
MRERRSVKIRGMVQGVFFRETVRRLASRYDVHGFVRNVGMNVVEIEAEGEPNVLEAFVADVVAHPPVAAEIEDVRSTSLPARGEAGFFIAPSVR